VFLLRFQEFFLFQNFASLWMIDSYPTEYCKKEEERIETDALAFMDFEIDLHDIIKGSIVVVKYFFSNWKETELQCQVCTEGLTNKLVKVQYKNSIVLVRIYGKGTDLLIDRQQELQNLIRLSQLGFCPGVYGNFTNGMVYGYVHGDIFSPVDMKDDHKSFLIAQHLASWHRIETNRQKPQLFVTLKRWLKLIPQYYSMSPQTKVMQRLGYTRELLEKECIVLQQRLEKLNSPVVFCHNDVQVGNIVYDSIADSVCLIDYEYGCVSYRGFDIGNHFCEFGGTNGDYSKYPSRDFQFKWFRNYLRSSGGEVTDQMLEEMYREVNAFALASHFFWSVWAIIQAEISDIDFDYPRYAELRLSEYFSRKKEWLP
jgi:ethanolamine kinase